MLSNRIIGDADRKRVLIVDDEETIRLALGRFLRSRGFEVDTASTGNDALDRIVPGRFAIMICDVRMPGMTGLELLPQVRERDADIGIMMLTAVNDTPTAAESLALGAMEYLMKPIELGELQLAIERVLHRRNLNVEQRNVERIIRDEVDRRTAALRRDERTLVDTAVEPIATLMDLAEAQDPYFVGMSNRVSLMVRAVAEALELPPGQVDHIAAAGRVHDVGRLAIPAEILSRPGPLTAEEFTRVQGHVGDGLKVLSFLTAFPDILESVRDHHERWDGSGYPRGIDGERIALGGRILNVVDSFVALTSRRPHRAARTVDAALEELSLLRGTRLDPRVLDALNTVVAERRLLGLTAD